MQYGLSRGGKEHWTFNRFDDSYERPKITCGLTPKSEKVFGSHPTQKPVYVMEWLIDRLTNCADTILDPFMGSGSIGVACVNRNRNFIGIELDSNYFSIARNRIDKISKNTACFNEKGIDEWSLEDISI